MNKLTLQFLKDNGVCDEAYTWTETTFSEEFSVNPVIDWDYGRSKLVSYCEQNPTITVGWVDWFDKLKQSEAYVKFNGSVITMGLTFQVFNPLDGTHTEYESEEAARNASVDIAKQILNIHKITVVQSISNENGDTAWTAHELTNPITVS
jgi:hypothetical protein